MATRAKRSISLPAALADAIDRVAEKSGTSFSAWLADTAAHRLRLEAGRRAIGEWEREHGELTVDERAHGLSQARRLLRRTRPVRASRRTA